MVKLGSEAAACTPALNTRHGTNKDLGICERQTGSRRAACSLFWTLDGKAAISGWRSVLGPARRGEPCYGLLMALSPRCPKPRDL
jgi:hypothetical protein